MSTTIAIAGGTGNVGRTISDALVATGKYKVILLGRGASKDLSPNAPPLINVDYGDIDAVANILEEHNVHTVISAIKVIAPEAGVSEVNLIKAAAKSSATKRFIQSEWGVPIPQEKDKFVNNDLMGAKSLRLLQHQVRLASIEQLRKSNLEWTRFYNGYFLDYYGMPYIETHISELITFIFDMVNKAAVIPGTGNDLVSFTYTRDVANFVVKALDLSEWEEEMFCYGDKVTLNQFLGLVEEATGSKFDVTYDSLEKLEKGEASELPANAAEYKHLPKHILQMYFSKFGQYIIAGLFDTPDEKSLNKVFPEVKTTTVEEVVGLWKGK
ncbi:NmrA domain-containing protein [Trichoderma simmonsii]|uniref:NmrA domain-containing protein n=1 Tax=Trichoderma simmonsii TaxID=1491479 RepID=A0A8G0LHU8_9HYPO|nr:NmrA domain-containing protein [Trichoderma simmonsii]